MTAAGRERAGAPAKPDSRYSAEVAKRRANRVRATPIVAIPAVAIPITFVVTQVRQALQQTVAMGACSPYFAAA
jgi:hypothetical protein